MEDWQPVKWGEWRKLNHQGETMKQEKQLANIQANVQRTKEDVGKWFENYLIALEFIQHEGLWVHFLNYVAYDARLKAFEEEP